MGVHRLFVCLSLAALCGAPAYAGGQQRLKVFPDAATPGVQFGNSVDLHGVLGVVGARLTDSNGFQAGIAYVFDVTTGANTADLWPAELDANDFYGWSVAIDGNFVVVGAPQDDDTASGAGAAYVHDATSGALLRKLLATDGALSDRLGEGVAVDGALAVVGAPGDDDNGSISGSAYVFDVTTGAQVVKLLAMDGQAFDEFGTSVAISGNIAVVGAALEDENGDRAGAAYVFNATTGQQLHKLLAPAAVANAGFGFGVAIEGDVIVVGEPSGVPTGRAHVFDATTGNHVRTLTPSGASTFGNVGASVSISGDRAVLGSRNDDAVVTNSGAAFVFDISTGAQRCKFKAADAGFGDLLGADVAISGAAVFAGAEGDVNGALGQGSAYVFTLCPADINADGETDTADLGILIGQFGTAGPEADLNTDGVVDTADLGILIGAFGTTCP